MASYTMTLRDCLATLLVFDDVDVSILRTNDLIEQGRVKLFDFEYEMFDTNYKVIFETNFIRNFYMREIGFETEDLFKFQLETWLRINMPYFNKMFQSELMEFDPLINSKMESTSTKNKDTDSTLDSTTNGDTTKTNHQEISGTENTDVDTTQNNDSFSRTLESDTPASRLAITTQDGAGVIEYASSIEENTNKGSNTTTNNVDTTTSNTLDGSNTDTTVVTGKTTNVINDVESYVSSRTGKTGSITYSEMLMKYRSSLIRVENTMFAEMQQLFMLVY